MDSQFRGLTKTPETVPLDVAPESGDLVIGRKNIGPEYSPAEFSFGSLAIYTRFLEKKDVEKVFGGKSELFDQAETFCFLETVDGYGAVPLAILLCSVCSPVQRLMNDRESCLHSQNVSYSQVQKVQGF